MKRKNEAASKAAPAPDPFPLVVETFRDPTWALNSSRSNLPSCINGTVNVVRYRVTVERIPEFDHVIAERIQHLWDVCDNHHHWDSLKAAGRKYGLDLQHPAGTKRVVKP